MPWQELDPDLPSSCPHRHYGPIRVPFSIANHLRFRVLFYVWSLFVLLQLRSEMTILFMTKW